ncbi:MAG: SUMF1/EgtB/PvdO family nonheme iron enzyme, partial [Terriglobales bacterium]
MDPTDTTQPTQLVPPSLAPCRGEEYVPALVRIPAGWFLMGCDAGQDNEKPVHLVWIDEFLFAARQVTNAEYGRFLGETASLSLSLPPFWSDAALNHPEQPVVGVSWHEAIRYCEWLNASTGGVATGRNFRLPTEAE